MSLDVVPQRTASPSFGALMVPDVDPVTFRAENVKCPALASCLMVPEMYTFPLGGQVTDAVTIRSEEHTSELQSRLHLVCRLLLEKKTKHRTQHQSINAVPTSIHPPCLTTTP